MSAVSHIGFMGGEAGADEESANGSLDRATVLAEDGMGDCGHSLSGQIRNAYPCGEQTSVAPGGGSMPAFTESEGDNGDAIAQEGHAAPLIETKCLRLQSVLKAMMQPPRSPRARWIRKP